MLLPYYQCFKKVQACKIKEIIQPPYPAYGTKIIVPDKPEIEPFPVPLAYFQKHDPQCGGYYVRYSDGYESYSPADQFEGGYRLIIEYDPIDV